MKVPPMSPPMKGSPMEYVEKSSPMSFPKISPPIKIGPPMNRPESTTSHLGSLGERPSDEHSGDRPSDESPSDELFGDNPAGPPPADEVDGALHALLDLTECTCSVAVGHISEHDWTCSAPWRAEVLVLVRLATWAGVYGHGQP